MTSQPAGTDQRWYWTPAWQAGETEATAEVAAGGLPVHDDMAALFDDLADDGYQAGGPTTPPPSRQAGRHPR